jgi:hypothetical protein
MDNKLFFENMVGTYNTAPSHAEIYSVRQHSVDELNAKMKRLLRYTSDVCQTSTDRADWSVQQDRTLVRLPKGGRAIIHHASGAMKITTGLQPMELMFEQKDYCKDDHIKMTESVFNKLNLDEFTGQKESLRFEKLWQIKAAAVNREQKFVATRLCRVIGAFRHFAGNLPVLGPASVAIKLASNGSLDSVQTLIRETSGEAIEWAPIISAEEAAHKVLLQLGSLMGKSSVDFSELITKQAMHIGYISFAKRKSQRILAPHYVAAISLRGKDAQAYQFVVPATEKTYESICNTGSHAFTNQVARNRFTTQNNCR